MTQSNSSYSEKLDLESKKEGSTKNQWWTELRHGGLLLSPAILEEMFPNGPDKIEGKRIEKLYDAYIKYITNVEKFSKDSSKLSDSLYRWLDAIFDDFLDVPDSSWIKENKVPEDLKVTSSIGEKLRPNRVLTYIKEHRYLIKIDKQAKTLGLGKSKREYTKFLELLRKTKIQLGVYTNGHQIRLVYAGLDHDSWIEWDVERWFEDPIGEELLAGFFHLCGRSLNFNKVEDKWALLHYVQYSRIKQSDLSSVLGNQVREAVEILLETLDLSVRDDPELLGPLNLPGITQKQRLNALYQASIRIIMRIVVVFFAEARELFPRSLERYDQSYGLEGLFRILIEAEQEEGSEILKNNISGWTRLLALFNLIYDGSPFSDIPIRPYGGILFRSGNSESEDLTLKAISLFENPRLKISDYIILKILRKLKIGKVKIKKGRSFTWVHGPVDFSELSAEYIGMMYEGLLDYHVRQVSQEEEAIIILKVGRQPALPITRLESLEEREMKELIDKLSKEKVVKVIKDEESDDKEEEEEDKEIKKEENIEDEESEEFQTTKEELYQRALNWAKKAMVKAQKVKKTKKMTNEVYEQLLEQTGKKFISREGIYGQGQYYLIQNNGNRKGSGTFYTKPQLVIPTVQRTLEPLIYKEQNDGRKVPKIPEKILSLKVCDPAMGSASFLVAALRYLVNALFDSLIFYNKIKPHNSNKTVISIPIGNDPSGELREDTFTIYAIQANKMAEMQIKSRLKRHIMENCIYGVDINPLAVELAKLSLWIETMDRDLPFTFIDHKLKVGNSMIGCFLSEFGDYPLMAWEREAGDSDYNNGVLFKKEELTKAIKNYRNEIIKPEMIDFIERLKGKTEITKVIENIQKGLITTKSEIIESYEVLGNFDKFDITKVDDTFKKEKFYFDRYKKNKNYLLLKQQMDLWCSIWFWNPVELDLCPTPLNYLNPSKETLSNVYYLSEKHKFFHWEIEFPDVFTKEKYGFDVVLGNPPWDTLEASSMEFFSNLDPIYRTYSNQLALIKQTKLFTLKQEIEKNWLNYSSFFKFFKNWVEFSSNPFGDYEQGQHFNLMKNGAQWRESQKYHNQWREIRKKKTHNSIKRYSLQGSGKTNTYKIFLELTIIYSFDKCRVGFLIPAALYGASGANILREYLLNKTSWEYLFCFENRKKIFANIHGSSKFCVIIFQKGIKSESIKVSFMHHYLSDWEHPASFLLGYHLDMITKFSPDLKRIIEISSSEDLQLFNLLYRDKIYLNRQLFYSQEINQTKYSKHFVPMSDCEKKGFKKNEYELWVNQKKEVLIPLYEGRLIGQFDFSKKKWVSGRGRTAKWDSIPFNKKEVFPQFLINRETSKKLSKSIKGYKISFIDVSSSTNRRTFIGFLDRDTPNLHSAPVLYTNNRNLIDTALFTAIMNSFVMDYALRFSISGNHLSYYILEKMPLPELSKININIKNTILKLTSSLSFIHRKFSPDWLITSIYVPEIKTIPWKKNWAITNYERTRIRAILDAIIAHIYNLDYEGLSWILRKDPSNLKGFWRVGKEDPEEIRLTTLTLKAFENLTMMGIDKFIEKEWQIPNELHESFQEELGTQYLDWQFEQSVDESWQECKEHAKRILGGEKYKEFINILNEGKDPFALWARSENIEKNEKKSEKKNLLVNLKLKIKNKEEKQKFKDIDDFIK